MMCKINISKNVKCTKIKFQHSSFQKYDFHCALFLPSGPGSRVTDRRTSLNLDFGIFNDCTNPLAKRLKKLLYRPKICIRSLKEFQSKFDA